MEDERAKRLAANEALFRHANEALRPKLFEQIRLFSFTSRDQRSQDGRRQQKSGESCVHGVNVTPQGARENTRRNGRVLTDL